MTSCHFASVSTSHLESKGCHILPISPPQPGGGAKKGLGVCYLDGRSWRTGKLITTQIKMTVPIQKP